jgi:thiol-disulfide isomerase/thioredoxin
LKNCVTDKDHDFVNNSAKLPGGHPASFIDSSLEYSNFSAVCKEPAQNYCGSNAQVISKYSPGGLLMVEQNDNNLTTNSGLSLTSAVINSNKKPAPIPQPSKQVIEHFAGAGAAIELVLIVFMASWCPHCKDAKPHLNQFKKKFHNGELDGVDVKVIEYDADVHKDEIKKHGVSGYPTYKLLAKYKDGSEKVHEHEGGRLFDDLVALCKKHL